MSKWTQTICTKLQVFLEAFYVSAGIGNFIQDVFKYWLTLLTGGVYAG